MASQGLGNAPKTIKKTLIDFNFGFQNFVLRREIKLVSFRSRRIVEIRNGRQISF